MTATVIRTCNINMNCQNENVSSRGYNLLFGYGPSSWPKNTCRNNFKYIFQSFGIYNAYHVRPWHNHFHSREQTCSYVCMWPQPKCVNVKCSRCVHSHTNHSGSNVTGNLMCCSFTQNACTTMSTIHNYANLHYWIPIIQFWQITLLLYVRWLIQSHRMPLIQWISIASEL